MSVVWKKIKCAVKEFFNFLTNLICPILSGVCMICELFQLPTSVIQAIKKAEDWCYQASGTKDTINNFVDSVDKAIEKTEDTSEEILKEDK